MQLQRNIVTGLLTAIPIIVTYLLFDFLLGALSSLGSPMIATIARLLQRVSPAFAEIFVNPIVQSVLGILLVLLLLYILGWAAKRVIGRRILGRVDKIMNRIPLVQTIYGATKKLIDTFQQTPDGVQRVVLINFPSPEMKTVGFVTKIMKDRDTGQKLAAVYVPTTPNPTSGYLEIVPVEQLISTDWTMDDAMTFIVSGGAVAPEDMNYSKSVDQVIE